MKINISYPSTGCQKVIEVDDDKKLRAFYDKRMSQEVEGDVLGDEFKGYVFRISGGNDKEGFAMKQGILTSQRVRILFSDGHSCFRIRRQGERKRKSIRGCIVSSALSVLNLVIVKKGDAEIPGLTDETKPRRLGPKRASRIRKLFNLSKKDDVRQYVVRRQINKEKKSYTKAPKIQRLITPRRLQHKRQLLADKRKRWEKSAQEAKAYNELVSKYLHEKREQKLARKRSASRRESTKDEKPAAPKQAKVAAPKKDEKKAAPAAAPKKDEKKGGDKKAAAPAAAPKKDEKKGGDKKAAAPAAAPKKDDKKAAAPKKDDKKGGDKKAAQPKKDEQSKKGKK